MFHLLKWLYPGMKMKRWLLLFAIGVMFFSLGGALAINYEYLGFIIWFQVWNAARRRYGA